jgi:DNA repair exonuclease SbcCD ATPase subunit
LRRADAAAAWQRIPDVYRSHPSHAEGGAVDGAVDASPPPAAAWDETEAKLRTAFDAAGGEAVRRAHETAAREAAGLAARHGEAADRWSSRLDELRTRLAALDVALPLATRLGLAARVEADRAPDPTLARAPDPFAATSSASSPATSPDDPTAAELEEAAQTLAGHLPARATTAELAERRERAQRELDVAEHERARLARELDLPGEVLDLAACEQALAETTRRHAVQRRARAMLETAGRRVVQQVMPSTIEHMRRLLPTLTAGRYFDAQLSEDYRIEVFDERAGDWLRKNLFSGGTRDQFSLALRLAFALATLPEERGVAPGFLFLDEPLGAFDDERARALIALLTEGEVAESFDQVFLISHVRVDPALFDHRIELEEGRISASTLPPPPESALESDELDGVDSAEDEPAAIDSGGIIEG